MKRLKNSIIPAVLLGSCMLSTPSCLPDNYFALSTRNIAVAIADTVLGNLIAPVLDTITPSMAPGTNTANNGG